MEKAFPNYDIKSRSHKEMMNKCDYWKIELKIQPTKSKATIWAKKWLAYMISAIISWIYI